MIAEEGRQHALGNGLQHRLIVLGKLLRMAGSSPQAGGDEALRLGGREQEEPQAAAVIIRDGGQPGPAFPHQVGIRPDGFAQGLETGERLDIPLMIAGVIAGDGIQAEAVHFHIREPEMQDVFDLLPYLLIVQVQIGHAAAGKALLIIPIRPLQRRKTSFSLLLEIVIGNIGAFLSRAQRLAGCQEPGMPGGGMVDGQIDDQLDPCAMRLFNQRPHILQRSVFRVDGAVIRHIVLMIGRAGHDGQEPQAVIPHIPDIIQSFRQAVQIADPVPVAVLIGSYKDLIPVMVLRQTGQDGKRRQDAQQDAKKPFHFTSPR